LRERYSISSAVQELDLRLHLPKHTVFKPMSASVP
jgi:hypothetical protein